MQRALVVIEGFTDFFALCIIDLDIHCGTGIVSLKVRKLFQLLELRLDGHVAVADRIELRLRAGEILSFAGTFYFRDGEAEIGPVATVPEARGKGYAHSVLAAAIECALGQGLAATLTTGEDNLVMRAVAEAVGMRPVVSIDQDC